MDWDAIVKYISEHKDDDDVKAFIDGLSSFIPEAPVTREKVLEYVTTDEGKEAVQPIIDQAVTKAIKTRDRNHESTMEAEVKRRLAAEMLKLNPQEEPWQKEIRELREANEREKAERAKDNLKRLMVEKAASIGVDPFFIEDYLPESIEVGELYLKKLKDHEAKAIEKAINERMAADAFKPGAGEKKGGAGGKNVMTASEYRKLPVEKRIEMIQSGNPPEVIPD